MKTKFIIEKEVVKNHETGKENISLLIEGVSYTQRTYLTSLFSFSKAYVEKYKDHYPNDDIIIKFLGEIENAISIGCDMYHKIPTNNTAS